MGLKPVLNYFLIAVISWTAIVAARAEHAPERMEFHGFSVLAPSGESWKSHIPESAPGVAVVFFKEVDVAAMGISPFHSFAAMVKTGLIDLPYEDRDKLLNSLRESIRAEFPPNALKALEAVPDEALGMDCLRYQLRAEDEDRITGKPSQVFVLHARGFRCLHTVHPAYVIDVSYSQRSYSGDWIAAFDGEADRFLTSLRFLPVMLGPYVAARLDEYALQLRQSGREYNASEMNKHAERMREAASSTESSFYLGFDPAAILKEYADFLRRVDEPIEARRIDILSEKWFMNQSLHFFHRRESELGK